MIDFNFGILQIELAVSGSVAKDGQITFTISSLYEPFSPQKRIISYFQIFVFPQNCAASSIFVLFATFRPWLE